ncbi:hypothetical protein HDV57DRAFT_411197 [Trichoderma longibrachiatum]|uniref:Uncharacterized protein n=1 Tax=Trichoderma longibrachiatum ATCC 18648 TaxID=983965 RepID=A0A2T4C2H1_TRILO|nr:hypothetical protein M440DRAFT_1402287 [Trichoderma longibrachiatum ATCC 18648]
MFTYGSGMLFVVIGLSGGPAGLISLSADQLLNQLSSLPRQSDLSSTPREDTYDKYDFSATQSHLIEPCNTRSNSFHLMSSREKSDWTAVAQCLSPPALSPPAPSPLMQPIGIARE